jgi:hypothetical protein
MNDQDRSHRRAVQLIVGLLLAVAFGVSGYEVSREVNWIRERRAFLAAMTPIAFDNTVLPLAAPKKIVLPGGPLDRAHSLAMRLRNERAQTIIAVPCPRESPGLFATFAGGSFPAAAVEDVDQVKVARRLFPEATIEFHFLVDWGTGKLLDPQPRNPLIKPVP